MYSLKYMIINLTKKNTGRGLLWSPPKALTFLSQPSLIEMLTQ